MKTLFTKNIQLQFVAAAALFGASAYLASHQTISDVESSVFSAIYDTPHWLRPVFLVITQAGSIYMLMALAALYFLKRHYHVVIRLLMSGLLAYLMAGVAKDLLGRDRPAELLLNLDIVVRDFYVTGPGFPSGHTALAAAIGLTLAHSLPKRHIWLPATGIVLVAWSRIFLGAHFPLDVVGGFALGWLAVLLFRHVRLSDIRGAKPLKK